MVDIVNSKSCQHNHHLFNDPLCKEQSIKRRIMNVIFHIFTLGIPYIIYRILACCFKDKMTDKKVSTSIDFQAILDGRVAMPEISSRGKDVIEEVENELMSLKDLEWEKPTELPANAPVNDQVYMLSDWADKCYLDLLNCLRNYKDMENSVIQKEVFDVAAKYFKVCYVLGIKLLEQTQSIKAFLSEQEGKEINNIDIFLDPRFDYDKGLYKSSSGYHNIRSFKHYDTELSGFVAACYGTLFGKDATLFYKEGSQFNDLRLLYNEFCNRIQFYICKTDVARVAESSGYSCCLDRDDQLTEYTSPYRS